MRFCGSTDPNSLCAPEPNVLSLERELGTDSLDDVLSGGLGGLKLRGQFLSLLVSKAVRDGGEATHQSIGSRSFVAGDISLIRNSRDVRSIFFVMSCQ